MQSIYEELSEQYIHTRFKAPSILVGDGWSVGIVTQKTMPTSLVHSTRAQEMMYYYSTSPRLFTVPGPETGQCQHKLSAL